MMITLMVAVDAYDPNRPKLGFKQRLHHFTWAWYTFPMSTGRSSPPNLCSTTSVPWSQGYRNGNLRHQPYSVYYHISS